MRLSHSQRLRIENRGQGSGVRDQKKGTEEPREETAERFDSCCGAGCWLSTGHCIINVVPADVSVRVFFNSCADRRGVPVEKP